MRSLHVAVVLSMTGLVASHAGAQPIETFKCKIVNDTGADIRVRVASFHGTFQVDLKKGQSYMLRPSEYFQRGEKAVVAFDDFKETVVSTSKIEVKGRTLITLTTDKVTYGPLRQE